MKIINLQIDENNRDYTICVGENEKENVEIIKNSNQNDTWFHLGGGLSSPHIVLKNNGDNIPKRYINYIGGLFRIYKKNTPHRFSVIYTQIKNVKLTEKTGTVITSKVKSLNY